MKKIFLSNGDFTLVSDEDYIFLFPYSWSQHKKGYVTGRIDGEKVRMNRVIAKRMGLNLLNQIDHINGDKLNNQRDNLRSATNSQNRANSKSKNKTGYKGVTKKRNKWQAQINVDGQKIYLGTFDSPEEAHQAYIKAAERYFGEFANS